MKKNIVIGVLIIFFLVQLILNIYLWKTTKMPKIHVLERPLKITSNFGNYSEYAILPEGTVLYDDSDSLNRRVKIYFNLQGLDLKFTEQNPEILKQPSEVSAIRSTDLPRILKTLPLTNKDIYLIIKHDEDISDNVREILFRKYKLKPEDFEK
ncbi:hypothetical protein [Acinetobacter celticus]|uniref:Uncharacterized protein n=1 Tax=Acinetobacter celticus TaxID=1891224 RepID=A0A1C3CYJ8_9GAMM|nr:hypothetical protein [Acinetobacter celticus]ODA13813.1 hypothetical protein BBP83_05495 [Acinetobacter celticus]